MINQLPDRRAPKSPAERQQNIQDGFLNSIRKERNQVTIYLVSGAKLTGRIRSFDKYSVVLESTNQEQLIFKHAISTIVLPRALAHPSPASQSGPAEGSASMLAAPGVTPSGGRQE
jgi:host factor-I protein